MSMECDGSSVGNGEGCSSRHRRLAVFVSPLRHLPPGPIGATVAIVQDDLRPLKYSNI